MAKAKFKGEKLTTPVFRASFVESLFKARASSDNPDAKPKFGLAAIWTPGEFSVKEKDLWRNLLKELDRAAQHEFAKPWKELSKLDIKTGLRDGAGKADYAGYGEGTRYASLTSYDPPGVCDKNKKDISPEDGNTDEIYAGCYCRATVVVYPYNNKGKGVAIGLRNIQKVGDGKRLDNRTAAKDDFDEDSDSKFLNSDDDYGEGATDDGDDFE